MVRQGIKESTVNRLLGRICPESAYIESLQEVEVHNQLSDLLTVWFDCQDQLTQENAQEFRQKFRDLRKAILASGI